MSGVRISIPDEIAPLLSVLVCSPGAELERVLPVEREDNLMEDVLSRDLARRQHEAFCDAMRRLMVAASGGAVAGPRGAALEGESGERGRSGRGSEGGLSVVDLRAHLAVAARRVAGDRDHCRAALARVVHGERWDEAERAAALDGLVSLAADDAARLVEVLLHGEFVHEPGPSRHLFRILPSPNALFARDYQFVLGGVVFISAMNKPVRQKESSLSHFLFKHGFGLPELWSAADTLADVSLPARLDSAIVDLRGLPRLPTATIEGGDVMALSDDTVLVGVSERTTLAGAELLARTLRRIGEERPGLCPFRELLIAEMPIRRAMMHLDTVFTLADRDIALAYPPLAFPGGRDEMRVWSCRLDEPWQKPLGWSFSGTFSRALDAWCAARGRTLALVAVGGPEPVHQHREQWTDGCNAVAMAPGVIVAYERNRETLAMLRGLGMKQKDRAGAVVVLGEQSGAEAALRPFRVAAAEHPEWGAIASSHQPGERLVATFNGGELGRARGGPHCMTMPLLRRSERLEQR